MKVFIEAMQLVPDVAPGHEKCTGGLFHGSGLIEVAIQIAVAKVDGISRPDPIDAEKLEDERSGGGQPANRKSGLRPGIQVNQLSSGEAVLAAGIDQGVNPRKKIGVWIQQKQELGVAGGDTLIDGCGESTIFAIRNELDVCPLADSLQRPIARCVIDDDGFHVGSHLNKTVQALADDGFRVEGHDDRRSSQK
jgi:hypothetical protein